MSSPDQTGANARSDLNKFNRESDPAYYGSPAVSSGGASGTWDLPPLTGPAGALVLAGGGSASVGSQAGALAANFTNEPADGGDGAVQRVEVTGKRAPWYERLSYQLENMFDPDSAAYLFGSGGTADNDPNAGMRIAAALAGGDAILSDMPPEYASGLNGPAGVLARPTAKAIVDYKLGPRTLGAAGMVLDGYGVVAGAGSGSLPLTALALDQMAANARMVVTGDLQSTLLNQGLRTTGMSPEAAAVVEMGVNVAALAPTVVSINRTLTLETQANAAARASYQAAPLSETELSALRNIGMSDAEIARSMEMNGDIYLFRGTSVGWPGNPGSQVTGISASIDPYAATVFAAEARGQGGQAVVQFGTRAEIGTFGEGNVFAPREREVSMGMSSSDFSTRAPNTIPVDTARAALQEMGMPDIPHTVYDRYHTSELLSAAPRMTPEQVADFIERVKAAKPR